ncbi:TetR family transcriptional regulator [Gordonia desulfuricans]|uniref:TetR family transcriptional regulator n=1 Tax=Gordonia desulfuricans TaxID=89051 RepID=A0A7K3LKR0_9ACTN|nr:TetR family transcriptional regulator [Gordonia desulfuricans]NDK88845.1 TetR family transcriptional regulator [Gordonia desulfuricans]
MVTLRTSRALATRQRLVDVATDLFTTQGFAAVTTTSLSEEAGVTRGALYHHFANMTEVMEAVFTQAESSLVESVSLALESVDGPRERFLALGKATLDALARDPLLLKVVFREAPTALGWTRWRALDNGRSLGLIRGLLEDLAESDALVPGVDPGVAAQLILGAINEAGMHAASGVAAPSSAADQLELLCRGLLRR